MRTEWIPEQISPTGPTPRERWRAQCRRFSDQALANQSAYGSPGGWSRAEILAEIERRGGITATADPRAARHAHPGRV